MKSSLLPFYKFTATFINEKLKAKNEESICQKRGFYGNRFSKKSDSLLEEQTETETSSTADNNTTLPGSDTSVLESNLSTASSSKIETILLQEGANEAKVQGYRLIDMSILNNIIHGCFACPYCSHQSLSIKELTKKKRVFASTFVVVCSNCKYCNEFLTSKICNNKAGCDVNRRSVYTMRSIGVGYTGLRKFAMLMNMPPPMTANNYSKINKFCRTAAKTVAEKSMSDAAVSVREIQRVDDDTVADIDVFIDDTWQRRGYSSLNGIVAAISVDTGKLVDCEPMTRFCNSCVINERHKTKDTVAYNSWKASHLCKINHRGSAPSMEAEGAKRIFLGQSKVENCVTHSFMGMGIVKVILLLKKFIQVLLLESLNVSIMCRSVSATD